MLADGKKRAGDAYEHCFVVHGTMADPAWIDPAIEPNGRKPGDKVAITPDDYGRDTVTGELIFSSAQEIAIRRHDPQVGEVAVHFPRAGFWVTPA